jgi:hypothetical protein
MRTAIVVLLVAGSLGTVLGAGGTRGEPVKPGKEEDPKLWAAVSIKPLVFDPYTFTFDRPKIHLGLVNDSTQVLETGLRESVLVVNGQPVRGATWDAALKACLRGDAWEKVAPREHVGVVCPLEDVITEPGTHRVSWRGKDFQSPEVVYRRLPRDSDSKPKPAAAQAGPKTDAPKESQGKLWAAISLIPPVMLWDSLTRRPAQIELYLGNDGTQAVETGADDSVLVVTDQSQRSWEGKLDLRNGLSGPEWLEMPPGGCTGKIRSLGWIITDPGVYRVSWKSKNFQSPEVVYRIIKAKAK